MIGCPMSRCWDMGSANARSRITRSLLLFLLFFLSFPAAAGNLLFLSPSRVRVGCHGTQARPLFCRRNASAIASCARFSRASAVR